MRLRLQSAPLSILFATLAGLFLAGPVQALDFDWSGQFRAENHWIRGYTLGNGKTLDATRNGAGGYYIPTGGDDSAHFQTLFMRVNPKVIVNDNVYIKSEWWLGNPIYGFYGNGFPGTADQRNFNTTGSRGSTISAQRVWADLVTDVGTLQIGRAPLDWGLGLIWNDGNGVFDRYQSTGDVVRMISKFGSFSIVPSVIKYGTGNNIGGACAAVGPACTPQGGSSSLTDISFILKYENPDEDIEGGVNFIRRIGGPRQDTSGGVYVPGKTTDAGPVPGGVNFTTWDLYAKKKFGGLTIGGEVPIITGDLGDAKYSTYAIAIEGQMKFNDTWDMNLDFGQLPGQGNVGTAASGSTFKAFYANPAYRKGFLMFQYQLANFRGPNTQNNSSVTANDLRSPFDNAMSNARYLNFGLGLRSNKWRFHANYLFATAQESAATGQTFYNGWDKKYYANAAGKDQEKGLGWEMNYGFTFDWDDHVQFGFDLGWFFPGGYYRFSNAATDNTTDAVFGSVIKAGISF